MNCTTTAPPSPTTATALQLHYWRSRPVPVGRASRCLKREQPLPQKRVVLSRTLHTAAPPASGYVRLSHTEKPRHTAYAFPPCSVRYRPTSKKGQS